MPSSNLLLVEDDDDLREMLTYYLQTRGHEVRTATNGVEALLEVERRYPDLVISDLEMPVLDGLSWIRHMIEAGLGGENVPIILMSGNPQLLRAAGAVVAPYTLEKPFSFEALDRMIELRLTSGNTARR